jgi:hypothetical protein
LSARTQNRVILLVVALGMLARCCAIYAIPLEPLSDFKRYVLVAQTFAQSGTLSAGGAPYIIQGPLYPLLLGLVFNVAGSGILAGKWFNAILGAVMLVAMAKAVERLNWPFALRVTICCLLAFHPGCVLYVNVLGTECLSMTLIALALLAATYSSLAGLASLGILLGLLSLTRPQLVPVVLLFVLLAGGSWRDIARRAVFCLVPFICVLMPWALRNEVVFGRFIPVSASAGYVLLVNNNAHNLHGGWMPLSKLSLSADEQASFDRNGNRSFFEPGVESDKVLHWTPDNDRRAFALAMTWIKSNPGDFLRLAWTRLRIAFWEPRGDMLYWPLKDVGTPKWLSILTCVVDVTLLLGSMVGMLGLVRHRGDAWRHYLVASLIVLGVLGGIAVFEGQGRYVLPMLPAAALLSGYATILRPMPRTK